MIKRINNQTSVPGLTHEQKHVHIICKGAYTRSEVNSYSCTHVDDLPKKPTTRGKIKSLNS